MSVINIYCDGSLMEAPFQAGVGIHGYLDDKMIFDEAIGFARQGHTSRTVELYAVLIAILAVIELDEEINADEIIIWTDQIEFVAHINARTKAPSKKVKQVQKDIYNDILGLVLLPKSQKIRIKFQKSHAGFFPNVRSNTLARAAAKGLPVMQLREQQQSIQNNHFVYAKNMGIRDTQVAREAMEQRMMNG